jgi:hypothetical protein
MYSKFEVTDFESFWETDNKVKKDDNFVKKNSKIIYLSEIIENMYINFEVSNPDSYWEYGLRQKR